MEIKVYLTNIKTEDNLCFHTIIKEKDNYEVFVDLNETYEDLMICAMKGNLEIEYFDKEKVEKRLFEIKEEDYKKNIYLFMKMLNDFYGLSVECRK